MFEVKSVDEVFTILKENFFHYAVEKEVVDIEKAIGRILGEDIFSAEDIPGFNRSSVDGYAVMAVDTFGASESMPAQLELAGEVIMGEKPLFPIKKGMAIYVPTGGELPENADAAVMIEYCEDLQDGYVYIEKSVAPGNHVVFKGDDIQKGERILPTGCCLRPQEIGLLAAVGKKKVWVYRKLRVGILSTGDEVVDIGSNPVGAQVRDINAYTVFAEALNAGAQPLMYGIAGDCYEDILTLTKKALEECDIVVVSGGSSVGTRDETYRVIEALGEPGILVHGIAVKPGKPTIIGRIGRKAVIGLPGHPASAYMIFKIFILPLIQWMKGLQKYDTNSVRAFMKVNVPSNHGREEFLPVIMQRQEGKKMVEPVYGKSGLISFLSKSDGYVRIPRETEGLAEGEEVEVFLL